MQFVLQPSQLFLVILAGWANREQQEVIEYLRTDTTVSNILKNHGAESAPGRRRTGSWETFLERVLKFDCPSPRPSPPRNRNAEAFRFRGGEGAVGVASRPDFEFQNTFLKSRWDVLAAIDFTTVEVWTKSGLVTFYLLFVMELKTRRVHFTGRTTSPHEAWMKQMALAS